MKLFEFRPVVIEEMQFKSISYLKLWWPLCLAERNNLCNFGRGHYEEHLCKIIFEFGPVVHEMFKDISYLELWRPLCSAEQNHLCNFGRSLYEEYFYEIILNLDQWFRKCHLKI